MFNRMWVDINPYQFDVRLGGFPDQGKPFYAYNSTAFAVYIFGQKLCVTAR